MSQGPVTATGAVLEEIGRPRPYAESRPLTISEVDLAPPGPGEIRVRVEAAGLCHSDLSVIDGNRPRPVPMLLGHEAAGIVEELGEGVDDLEVGQRVVMVFLPRCGECRGCRTDGRLPCEVGSAANNDGTLLGGGERITRDGQTVKHHLGVSGFATRAVVNRASVVPVGDDIPPQAAAVLGCAVLTGGGALLNAARPLDGDDVAIVGLGGVGMAALLVAKALGTGKVYAVDALESKLEQARELGADEALTPDQALERGIKAAVVVEAAGHPKAFELAVTLTGRGGTTVTVGLPAPGSQSTIEPLGLTAEARSIVGSYLGSAVPSRDIAIYEQMWREGRLPVEKLISSTITLDQVNEAMDRLADGLAVRQVILFD